MSRATHSFMAKASKETDDWPYPEIGARLRRIRELFKDRKGKILTQEAFAIRFGFTKGNWNHYEKGASIPWWEAVRLADQIEGITTDYIYRERFSGVPLDLRDLLVEP